MSLIKTRSTETLQRILSSFKQFERKLDKLQDDVNCHGQTLTDLRVLIANLSGGTLYDAKVDHTKGVSKTTAMDSFHFNEAAKTKRKSLQPLHQPSKVMTKSFQGQKFGIKPSKEPVHFNVKKMSSAPKSAPGVKRSPRQKKGEITRKVNPIRAKKVTAKKSKSPPQSFEFPSQFKRPLF